MYKEIVETVHKRQSVVAWDAWLTACMAHRRLLHLHVKAARLHELQTLRKTMTALKKSLDYRKWQVLQRSQAVVHFFKSRCGVVLACWRTYAKARQQRNMKLSRAASHAALRLQQACVKAFKLHLDNRKRLRQAFLSSLSLIMLRIRRSKLPCILACWQHLTVYYKSLQLLKAAINKKSSSHFTCSMIETYDATASQCCW